MNKHTFFKARALDISESLSCHLIPKSNCETVSIDGRLTLHPPAERHESLMDPAVSTSGKHKPSARLKRAFSTFNYQHPLKLLL